MEEQVENKPNINNLLRIAEKSKEIGADILKTLDVQTEQFYRMNRNLGDIDENMEKADGILTRMEKWYVPSFLCKKKFRTTRPNKEVDKVRISSITQYKVKTFEEKDELDELYELTLDMKEQANMMNVVLDSHNRMIDVISDNIDKNAHQIKKSTKRTHDLM